MDKCFIIQPFDGGIFDKRYNDVFEPAVKEAGFEPYRVDKDPSVKIPIDDIEKGIEDAKMCFAEITTDNPNVWYELGYAFALKKDVILVCQASERKGKFPFDIQHRHIITYESNSSSDFDKLKIEITKKIKALAEKQKKIENLIENPVVESEGLKPHELTLMIIMINQLLTDTFSVSAFSLRSDMEKAGFTNAATSLAIRSLKRMGLINVIEEADDFNQPYSACTFTPKGETWILNHQDMIQIRKEKISVIK